MCDGHMTKEDKKNKKIKIGSRNESKYNSN
jgi:hypothetical protein